MTNPGPGSIWQFLWQVRVRLQSAEQGRSGSKAGRWLTILHFPVNMLRRTWWYASVRICSLRPAGSCILLAIALAIGKPRHSLTRPSRSREVGNTASLIDCSHVLVPRASSKATLLRCGHVLAHRVPRGPTSDHARGLAPLGCPHLREGFDPPLLLP